MALSAVVGCTGGIYGIGGGSILAPVLTGSGRKPSEVAPAALASTFVTSVAGVITFTILAAHAHGSVAPAWPAGIALGLVNWRRHQATPAAHSWEIGIALVPEARGHGYGTRAQRLLTDYLFAHTAVHRIWAATEVDNIAEQKALASAGFTREGVHRGIGWRDGGWRDGVTYSLLRTDPR